MLQRCHPGAFQAGRIQVRAGDEISAATAGAMPEIRVSKPALRRADLYYTRVGYAARPNPTGAVRCLFGSKWPPVTSACRPFTFRAAQFETTSLSPTVKSPGAARSRSTGSFTFRKRFALANYGWRIVSVVWNSDKPRPRNLKSP